MATIPYMPSAEVIRAFRKVLDFYCFRGSFAVRSWPRSPRMPRSAPVQATGAVFGTFSTDVAASAPEVRNVAESATASTRWTWKDLMVRAAYHKLHRW